MDKETIINNLVLGLYRDNKLDLPHNRVKFRKDALEILQKGFEENGIFLSNIYEFADIVTSIGKLYYDAKQKEIAEGITDERRRQFSLQLDPIDGVPYEEYLENMDPKVREEMELNDLYNQINFPPKFKHIDGKKLTREIVMDLVDKYGLIGADDGEDY